MLRDIIGSSCELGVVAGFAADLEPERAAIRAFLEPRQYIRKHGRVLFDTMRFAQTGCWTGTPTTVAASRSRTTWR